jgi:hypothetical protein
MGSGGYKPLNPFANCTVSLIGPNKETDMIQLVEGIPVYVVDLKTMPQLPIVGTGIDQYYAEALTLALRDGVVAKPGKYGIYLNWDTKTYQVFEIKE